MKATIRRIVLLLVVAGVGYYIWSTNRTVRTDTINISGNLELTQVDLSFKTPGRLTELNVREGDFVKKGTVIARLDSAQLTQQRSRDEAAVAAARSNLEQLKTSIEYQQATIDSDIAVRRAEVAQAEARLNDLLAGSRQQEITQSQAALADARAWNDSAKLEWDRAQTLYKNQDISTQQYDQAKTKVDSTAALVRQAEQRLALIMEGPRKEEIVAARAAVTRAQAAVTAAEANRIELRRKQQELGARSAEVQRNQAQVGITDAQLSDTTIVAPIDGVVLVKSAENGEVVAAGTTVVSLGDIEHPWLRAYVSELDLGRVKLGEKVNLSTDSFPGKVYEGTVTFIASEAEFTPKQIQTKEERAKLVYRIKVEVDNSHRELKNNMPVDAELKL